MAKRYLLKHVGNMGDLVFFIPPVLETLKKHHPDCHITLVTAWGFKDKRGRWGKRNQGGFCIGLMMTNPHIDQLVHWHDTALALDGSICQEEGQSFPTWNAAYFKQQAASGAYTDIVELDFGITPDDNPLQRMYEAVGLPQETFSRYQLYVTEADMRVAEAVMREVPHPRIVLLEGLAGTTTRGWDPAKVEHLEQLILQQYGVAPLWFGGRFIPEFEGRSLTLRENIATLRYCDVGIGVLSGPLHFAVAVQLPTITLYADQSLHRAAPAYFLNDYITDTKKQHRTILGPLPSPPTMLKSDTAPAELTAAERSQQDYRDWTQPGRQATKAALAPITAPEVLTVLQEMV